MSELFCTSDLHLQHYNVVLHCNRKPWMYKNPNYKPNEKYNFKHNNPYAVHLESHNQDLISNWNKLVGHKDEVKILGDLAWKDHTKYIMALNGSKTLIRGNHDKMPLTAYQLFKRIDGTYHYHYSYYTEIGGKRVMFSHAPYLTWFSSCHGSFNLHGHCHGRNPEKIDKLQFDVGVDVWNYSPVPWDIIILKMKEKEELKKEFFANKSQKDYVYQETFKILFKKIFDRAIQKLKILKSKEFEMLDDEDNERIEGDEKIDNVEINRKYNMKFLKMGGISCIE